MEEKFSLEDLARQTRYLKVVLPLSGLKNFLEKQFEFIYQTEMYDEDLCNLNLLVDLFKGLYCSGDMVNYQIPVEGTYYADNMDGADVLVPDMEANSAYLKSYIYGEETS